MGIITFEIWQKGNCFKKFTERLKDTFVSSCYILFCPYFGFILRNILRLVVFYNHCELASCSPARQMYDRKIDQLFPYTEYLTYFWGKYIFEVGLHAVLQNVFLTRSHSDIQPFRKTSWDKVWLQGRHIGILTNIRPWKMLWPFSEDICLRHEIQKYITLQNGEQNLHEFGIPERAEKRHLRRRRSDEKRKAVFQFSARRYCVFALLSFLSSASQSFHCVVYNNLLPHGLIHYTTIGRVKYSKNQPPISTFHWSIEVVANFWDDSALSLIFIL